MDAQVFAKFIKKLNICGYEFNWSDEPSELSALTALPKELHVRFAPMFAFLRGFKVPEFNTCINWKPLTLFYWYVSAMSGCSIILISELECSIFGSSCNNAIVISRSRRGDFHKQLCRNYRLIIDGTKCHHSLKTLQKCDFCDKPMEEKFDWLTMYDKLTAAVNGHGILPMFNTKIDHRAERAAREKCNALRDEILLRFGTLYDDMTQMIMKSNKKHQDAQQELLEMRTQVSKLETCVSNLETCVSKLETQIAKKDELISKLEARLTALEDAQKERDVYSSFMEKVKSVNKSAILDKIENYGGKDTKEDPIKDAKINPPKDARHWALMKEIEDRGKVDDQQQTAEPLIKPIEEETPKPHEKPTESYWMQMLAALVGRDTSSKDETVVEQQLEDAELSISSTEEVEIKQEDAEDVEEIDVSESVNPPNYDDWTLVLTTKKTLSASY